LFVARIAGTRRDRDGLGLFLVAHGAGVKRDGLCHGKMAAASGYNV